MDRFRAQKAIYEVVNSGILDSELEDTLREVASAIECGGEGFDGAGMEAVYHKGQLCDGCDELPRCADGKIMVEKTDD